MWYGLSFVVGATLAAVVFCSISFRSYNKGYEDGYRKGKKENNNIYSSNS